MEIAITCPKCCCLTLIREEWLSGNFERKFYRACPLCDTEHVTSVSIKTEINEEA